MGRHFGRSCVQWGDRAAAGAMPVPPPCGWASSSSNMPQVRCLSSSSSLGLIPRSSASSQQQQQHQQGNGGSPRYHHLSQHAPHQGNSIWVAGQRHHQHSTRVAARSHSQGREGTGVGTTQPQATTPQQPAGSPASAQQPAARYSPLHYNILDLCQKLIPTEEETKYKQHVITLIRAHTQRAMQEAGRRCEVQVFGSFATGLATWSSDVDLVVTGIMTPDRHSGVYDVTERGQVVGRLRKIGEALRRCKKLDNPRISIIPRARIPIIKLKVRNVAVDISMSDDTGPRAARYMAQQVRAYPPMRPLVLVLKAYLRSVGLNEVMHGGLSSYSLCNMVVAHLQEELKAGRDIYDLGEALYAFLLRYGEEFDYGHDAVSIESGGIVPKHALGMHTDVGRGMYGSELERYMERLAVDCPVTGRDVSNGTFRIDAVRASFQRAARRLEALARGRKVDDMSVNYLQALFDVHRITKRTVSEYEDDFIRVLGRGTSPEIIQISRGKDEWDEEEILGTTDDELYVAESDDMWVDSDSESLPPETPRGSRGKRGGPRGKGSR